MAVIPVLNMTVRDEVQTQKLTNQQIKQQPTLQYIHIYYITTIMKQLSDEYEEVKSGRTISQ